MFGDLDRPLSASRGLSAIAEFLALYYDVVLHSVDYGTAYYDVSIVPMAVSFNGETFLSPLSTWMINSLFLHFTIEQQNSGALWPQCLTSEYNRRLQAINLFLTALRKPQAILPINSSSSVQDLVIYR